MSNSSNKLYFLGVYPLFVFLLPVFFVLHEYTENYDFVPAGDAILLSAIYLFVSLILLLMAWLFYRNWSKAAVLTFLLMGFHFFFGSIQDGLRNLFPGSFITKYVFILPLALLLFILVVIVLKRRKRSLGRLTYYLNFLSLLVILFDVFILANKMIKGGRDHSLHVRDLVSCPSCVRPDIYLIIADEYAGAMELKDIFQFDNSPFLEQLNQRGFHVIPKSSANYNFTPYSIASTLNMDYLGDQPSLTSAYETVRDNRFLAFLQSQQYRFYNYSYFDFTGQPAPTQETFLPSKTRLITSQTFLSRINKELRFNLVTKFNSGQELRNLTYANRRNNERLFNLTLSKSSDKASQPKFVFTHLMIPHYPYYFDSQGNDIRYEQITEGDQHNQRNQHNYIGYLQYGNKKLLELIDGILKNSASPPIIILMGDHGFRHFEKPQENKYYFSNLMSICLPQKDYTSFTDSLSNVNLLRTVLNLNFKQQLPYLKDSTIIIENP